MEIFDKDLPIKIYTDASLEGIRAVLKQTQPNKKDKPVGYFSKKLNGVQKRKKVIYPECLAIKEAVQYWQHWLIGTQFIISSDHKPLKNKGFPNRDITISYLYMNAPLNFFNELSMSKR